MTNGSENGNGWQINEFIRAFAKTAIVLYTAWVGGSLIYLIKQDSIGPRYTAEHAKSDDAKLREYVQQEMRSHERQGGHAVMQSRMERVEKTLDRLKP